MSSHPKRQGPRDSEPPLGFPEILNPGVASEIARSKRRLHPFEGDEHGHDRHDTIPAEEEWLEDDLRPSEEHNPSEK
ncbi:MAG TPA: hypothetical protein VLA05_11205 [Coriobacteriia bacterium]|nr:hypothetical protein [Coriobacteriia bacterium]